MSKHDTYFHYLQGRSRLGLVYRRMWLYRHLCQYLTGYVLDVGCGIGDLLSYRANTVGVDINPKTVEWCKKKGLDVHFMERDHLPFGDRIFDSAILDNVLEHLEDPGLLLAEVHRILGNKGVLVVGVPGTCGYLKDPDHKIYYSEQKLIETVSNYGFNVRHVFAMPLNQSWLEKRLSQYCVYGVFERVGKDK